MGLYIMGFRSSSLTLLVNTWGIAYSPAVSLGCVNFVNVDFPSFNLWILVSLELSLYGLAVLLPDVLFAVASHTYIYL